MSNEMKKVLSNKIESDFFNFCLSTNITLDGILAIKDTLGYNAIIVRRAIEISLLANKRKFLGLS